MLEKIRRTKKVDINMAMVGTLMKYQKDINERLRGTNLRCTLHPKLDVEPCASCSLYKKCKKNKKEREYIHTNHIAHNTSKRRKQKECKGELNNTIMDSYDETVTDYPCGEFEFTCPDKEACDGGQYCLYR